MTHPISDVLRRIVLAGGVASEEYDFNFEILNQTDIDVYLNDDLLTLTTDYTVAITAGEGSGTVTITNASLIPTTSSDTITLVGSRAIARTTDFVTGGDLFANTLNEEFDSQVIFSQQLKEQVDRSIKAPVTDPIDVDMTLPLKSERAGKVLSFHPTTGNVVATDEIGDWLGTWAAATEYAYRDLVYDSNAYAIYRCNTAHTSSGALPVSTNTDAAKWDLIADLTLPINNSTITVSAGTALSGGGSFTLNQASNGTITLSVSGLTVAEIHSTAIITSLNAFDDTDAKLMTAAKIDDHIVAKGYITGNESITISGVVEGTGTTAITAAFPSGGVTLPNGSTATTQATTDDSTKIATTAYVNDRIGEVIDAAPAALDTLNELAAAIGDDANFASTVTTSLGTKLTKSSNLSDLTDAATARTNLGVAIGTDVQAYSSVLANTTASYTTAEETKLAGIETGATADQTAGEIKTAYESNADTNAFTDAEKTKLSGIETSADVTDATNVAAAGAVMDGDFSANGLMKRTGAGVYTSITDSSTNWDSAYTDTNAATNANTASTIVKRDLSGNFNAGTITASLTGNVTGNLTGNVSGNVTGDVTGNADTATNATNVAVTQTSTFANYYIPFASGYTSGNYALGADAGLSYNPNVNTLYTTNVTATYGFFNQYVRLVSDDDYVGWGSNNDTIMFYDGVNNTFEMELEADATGFIITDNGTTRFTFDKSTGDFTATGDVAGANLNVTNWDTAYGWGDHGTQGYLTDVAFSDIQAGSVLTSAEVFVDTDTQVMSAAAINDRIEYHINNLVDSAPAALDTLNELAAALGDDANFSTTVTNSLATKIGLTDLSVSTAAASGAGSLAYNNTTGAFTFTPADSVTNATNATNADNVALTSTFTNASFYIPFANGNTTGDYALGVNSGLYYNPLTSRLYTNTISAQYGLFSVYISLTGDDNYISWGSSQDAKMFYDGVNNTFEMELETDATSFIITDNGTTRFTFAKATGDFTATGDVNAVDGTFSGNVTGSNLNVSNWNTAYGWGDHASAGYVTASSTNTFTNKSGNISQWTNDSGYLTSQTSHADVVVDGDFASQGLMKRGATAGSYSIVTDNSTNWDTAYSWGNHASAGYLTDITGESLGDLSNVTLTSPTNGQVLKYNGSAWVNDTDAGGIALTDLSVSTGTASGAGALSYNNTTGVFTFTPADSVTTATNATNLSGGTVFPTVIDIGDGSVSNYHLRFGSSDDARFFYNGTPNTMELYLATAAQSFVITSNGTTKFTFARSTGDFTATGDVNAVDGTFSGNVTGANLNVSNWDTAYGWGNHASAGYLTTETYTGTVTSVAATVPTGLSVSGSPITSSGTLAITFAAGYSIPTTTKQGQWDTAYGWGDHSSAGYLTGITGQSIKNLSDVYSGMTPTDGQVLTYDTTNGWQAETPSGGGGGSATVGFEQNFLLMGG